MRAILFSDLHNNNRAILGRARQPVYLDVLGQIYNYARKYHCSRVISLGDTFDSRYNISIEVLCNFYNFVSSNLDIQLILLPGNHEYPDKNNTAKTILYLFKDIAKVILTPATLETANNILMPWRSSEQYLKELREFVRGRTIPTYLFSHITLKEGRVSEGRMLSSSKIGKEDLYDIYPFQGVYLGDVHKAQIVDDRGCFYLGSAVATEFGEENEGCYLWEEGKITRLPLQAPRFRVYEGKADDHNKPIALENYKTEDYNKIYAPANLCSWYKEKYPEAQVIEVHQEKSLEKTAMRLNQAEELPELLRQYLTSKGPVDEYTLQRGVRLIDRLKETVG